MAHECARPPCVFVHVPTTSGLDVPEVLGAGNGISVFIIQELLSHSNHMRPGTRRDPWLPVARTWRSVWSCRTCLPRPPVILSQKSLLSAKTATSFPEYTPALDWPGCAFHSFLSKKAFTCMRSHCVHTQKNIFSFFCSNIRPHFL